MVNFEKLNKGAVALFEIIISLVIIGLLMAVALNILLDFRIDAERVSLEDTVMKLQTALNLQLLQRLTKNKDNINYFHCFNPIDLLLQVPSNYLGELKNPDLEKIPRGSWYFDKNGCMLVYIIKYPKYFVTTLAEPKRARFRVKLVYTKIKEPEISATEHRAGGILLEPVETYYWLKLEE